MRDAVSEYCVEVSGHKMVSGCSMSPDEERATWKSLSVAVKVENAWYQFDGKNRKAYKFTQSNVPKSVKVEISRAVEDGDTRYVELSKENARILFLE